MSDFVRVPHSNVIEELPDAESQAGAEDEKRMQLIAHARKILEDDMKRRATPKPQTPKPQR